jgi:hypothetical protein
MQKKGKNEAKRARKEKYIGVSGGGRKKKKNFSGGWEKYGFRPDM